MVISEPNFIQLNLCAFFFSLKFVMDYYSYSVDTISIYRRGRARSRLSFFLIL